MVWQKSINVVAWNKTCHLLIACTTFFPTLLEHILWISSIHTVLSWRVFSSHAALKSCDFFFLLFNFMSKIVVNLIFFYILHSATDVCMNQKVIFKYLRYSNIKPMHANRNRSALEFYKPLKLIFPSYIF